MIQIIYAFFVFLLPVEAKYYIFVRHAGTFDQANIFCKNEFRNGRLAIIKDEASEKLVKTFLTLDFFEKLPHGKFLNTVLTLVQPRFYLLKELEI